MKTKVIKVDLKVINPKREELTADKLRELIGKPGMSEEEAIETILAIKILVNIILQHQASKDKIDNLNIAA